MHFTRPRELLIAAVIGFGLIFFVFQVAYGSLPRLPTFAGVTLAILAVVEGALAFVVRNMIRTGKVITGVWIARAVALAKASSLLGALMLGAWLAGVVYLAPRSNDITAAADDLPAAVVGAVCAGVLIGAALWLEHCCRAPDLRDRDRDRRTTG
ncbi:hypothetical protein BAY61_28925 [Prauserella marina]|uniref:Uncharacterized protein n=1 Tax=Prauserella marina TaxID=530584 RepID=A0A222VWT3_9PSEU|nr:DUF3180 domain-containing protein [Prauserella marina]ASR38364.1 hypothetical protein BAY61_28925 [Prauserella marina]PWV78419.1 uncharacterized protein DUF3180 [Prauserella marina]SDC85560.1 Protein of unknown function [Prauserella marina]